MQTAQKHSSLFRSYISISGLFKLLLQNHLDTYRLS